MRIAIVGGGLAGLTTAWLLDDEHEVVVLEAARHAGGHAHSVRAQGVTVDLGAQYLSPTGFPAHGRLLRLLGLSGADLMPAPLTLTVTGPDRAAPMLVTPHLPDERRGDREPVTGRPWKALSTFLAAAAKFQATDPSWEIPLADLVEPLPLARETKDWLLYPLLAHHVRCANEQAPGVSARAAIDFCLSVSAASGEHAPLWSALVPGSQDVARRLADALPHGAVRTGSPVGALRRDHGRFEVVDAAGRAVVADCVVLAVPAPAALSLLSPLAGTHRLRLALGAFTYTPAEVAVHLDPAYQPADRRHWSAVNLQVHDGWAEAAHWYGPALGVDVFKSWITYRDRPPAEVVAQRSFRQLVVTPAAVRARNTLAARQGHGGIYLAGSHLTGSDSQESAVRSALAVAELLTPHAARLRELTDGIVSPA
ncbi:FAD-dependent oxidoreductase [Nonomuraea endophytica]|uniref:Putative NAD/FAD-binding protein n=1 Tax=Nonomuraea endophytica TaxID=714136 RepID=A0A7W8AEP1_9ACTN|nr:FAD-dependent oxidoreductase [Nonomuraea endophytica]MBB5084750.1 putative NAD/FAD-binding protein [Nonomuraea endophytica]